MDELERLLLVNDIFNVIGGACGLAAVLLIVGLTSHNRAMMDRFSIRFTLAISLVDFLKAVAIPLAGKANAHPALCVVAAFSVNWLLLLYLFLNVAIAANLQMVFLSGKVASPSRERACWLLCFAMATAITLIPLGKQPASN